MWRHFKNYLSAAINKDSCYLFSMFQPTIQNWKFFKNPHIFSGLQRRSDFIRYFPICSNSARTVLITRRDCHWFLPTAAVNTLFCLVASQPSQLRPKRTHGSTSCYDWFLEGVQQAESPNMDDSTGGHEGPWVAP